MKKKISIYFLISLLLSGCVTTQNLPKQYANTKLDTALISSTVLVNSKNSTTQATPGAGVGLIGALAIITVSAALQAAQQQNIRNNAKDFAIAIKTADTQAQQKPLLQTIKNASWINVKENIKGGYFIKDEKIIETAKKTNLKNVGVLSSSYELLANFWVLRKKETFSLYSVEDGKAKKIYSQSFSADFSIPKDYHDDLGMGERWAYNDGYLWKKGLAETTKQIQEEMAKKLANPH